MSCHFWIRAGHTGHVDILQEIRACSCCSWSHSLFSLLFSPFLCVPCPLLFSVSLAWGDMLAWMLKGLWQVFEEKIVPKPLTKVSLNSGTVPATRNEPRHIYESPATWAALWGPALENTCRNATVPSLGKELQRIDMLPLSCRCGESKLENSKGLNSGAKRKTMLEVIYRHF